MAHSAATARTVRLVPVMKRFIKQLNADDLAANFLILAGVGMVAYGLYTELGWPSALIGVGAFCTWLGFMVL